MTLQTSRLRLIAGALVCTMLLAGVTRVLSDDHYSGTLTSVSENQVMMSAGDETKMFAVHGATMVSLDGKPASLAELKAGDSARIMAQQQGDDGAHVAIRIDADRDGG
jgi:hypothetical protein